MPPFRKLQLHDRSPAAGSPSPEQPGLEGDVAPRRPCPIFKACNAHHEGREVKVLSLRYRGTAPEPPPSCSGSTDWISRGDSPCRDPIVRNRVP